MEPVYTGGKIDRGPSRESMLQWVLSYIQQFVLFVYSTSSTCFDGIIAVSSVFELILARMAGSGSSRKSVMSVFRSLRLVRLFKMVKQWKSLHSLLNTMVRAASDVQSFGILFNLFVFVSLT